MRYIEKPHQQVMWFFLMLRGPESNRGLEVMSLPRYLSSTPLYVSTSLQRYLKSKVARLYVIYLDDANTPYTAN